jgi:hypothetical protein
MTRKAVAGAYLVLVGAVLVHGWLVPRHPAVGTVRTGGQQGSTQPGGDSVLFSAVVQRLQSGESYYVAMGTELQARGYPTASPFNWRTPLHLWVLASVSETGGRVILGALAIAALALMLPSSPAPRATLMAVGVPVVASTILVALSEAWAGTLIALSLGAYLRRWWTLAALCGVLAVFIRELSVAYVLSAAAIALCSRRKRESLVWIFGGAIYLAYYGWHVHRVLAAMPEGARSHGASWVQWGGLSFVYRTVECYGWATLAPFIVVPLVVAAGLLGVVSDRMPLQARVALVGYLAAFSVVGLPINRYWGLVTVPLWGFGVLHALSGLQRLRSVIRELPGDAEPPAASRSLPARPGPAPGDLRSA